MALIQCKECGRQISNKAPACPDCGAPISKLSGKLAVWGIVGVVILGAVGILSNSNVAKNETPRTQTASAAETLTCSQFTNIESPKTSPERFDVQIAAAIQGDPAKPVVAGKTNLPAGTKFIVSLERPASAYKAQAKAVVSKDGCYAAGPFTQAGEPINTGKYTADVLMPASLSQPDFVQKIIGNRGQNISGNLVRRFLNFGKIAEFKVPYSFGVADAAKDKETRAKADSQKQER